MPIPLRQNSKVIDASWFNSIIQEMTSFTTSVSASFVSLQATLQSYFDTQIDSFRWVKYTVAFGQVSTAALETDIELFQLPAKFLLRDLIAKPSISFLGGAISGVEISIGISTDFEKYFSLYDVFQTPSGTTFKLSNYGLPESFTAATSVRFKVKSTGANLSALTQGSVEIYVKKEVLP